VKEIEAVLLETGGEVAAEINAGRSSRATIRPPLITRRKSPSAANR